MRLRWRESATRVQAEVTALLAWWLEELRVCGENLLGRIAPRSLTRTVIALDRAGGDISTVRGKDRQSVLHFTCEAPGEWPEDLEPFGSPDAIRGTRGVVALSGEFVLVHEIVLPRALEREVDQVIPLQLERELPLPTDRLALDWRISRRSRGEGRITVEVLIVHRALIERVKSLTRAWRIDLMRIGLAREARAIAGDFLRTSRRVSPLRLNATEARLALTAGALAVLWGLLIGGQWVYERVRVGRALDAVNPHALLADRIREELRAAAAPGAALVTLMREPDALDALTALTEAVPADSWAYEVDIGAESPQAAEIKASTFTPTATTLVDLLGRSPQFGAVRSVSATPAGLFAGDRLKLTARWANPPAAASAPQVPPGHLAKTGARDDRG
jgi:hypothetical protein